MCNPFPRPLRRSSSHDLVQNVLEQRLVIVQVRVLLNAVEDGADEVLAAPPLLAGLHVHKVGPVRQHVQVAAVQLLGHDHVRAVNGRLADASVLLVNIIVHEAVERALQVHHELVKARKDLLVGKELLELGLLGVKDAKVQVLERGHKDLVLVQLDCKHVNVQVARVVGILLRLLLLRLHGEADSDHFGSGSGSLLVDEKFLWTRNRCKTRCKTRPCAPCVYSVFCTRGDENGAE